MTLSASTSGWPPAGRLPHASPSTLAPWPWRDRLLLSAFLLAGLLISYQLGVTLAHPPWIGPVTDWLRAALAWPELAVVVAVSWGLTRTRQVDARSWWLVSAALLSYTVARSLWTVDDQLIFSQGVPFPTFPDLFFVLQYPFFFLAVMLMPSAPPWGPRLKRILDGLLWTSAATALSWYFILAPKYLQSGISPLARWVCLAYPVGDLALLFGVVLALLRPSRSQADRLTLYGLCVALVCLLLADSWVNALLLVNPRHVYVTGEPPDLFWLAFYLLVPLAALVRLRLAHHEPPKPLPVQELTRWQLQRQDLLASLRFLGPLVAALLARAQAHALALREANQRMEAFLGIASHELKTPLTSLQGNVELLTRRLGHAQRDDAGHPEELGRVVALAQAVAERLEPSLRRLGRLVDDVLDESRIQSGRLEFRMVSCDLSGIVRAAVEEQRQLASTRTLHLELPDDAQPVLVFADASRIEQVVTNYLTNALKYSQEDRPVAVRLQVEGATARVSVRDAGIGVPLAEQAHVWERFHRAEGVSVQSGSGVGIGIGLHICKTIIEAHGGQVGVRSAPGQGSTFWFTLPLAQEAQNGLPEAPEHEAGPAG